MADDPTTDPAPVEPAPSTVAVVPPTTDATDYKAEAEKWKALARKHEGSAKVNSDAAKKLAEIEEAAKSDQQKLTDKLSAAEVELAQFRTREVRLTATRDAGLDSEWAEYITEVEPAAALAQAKRLAERVKPGEPRPADLKQGTRGAPATPAADPNAWIRAAAGRT